LDGTGLETQQPEPGCIYLNKISLESPETTDFEYEIFRVPQILFSALQSLKRNRTGTQIKPASS
jgi:hypothetical protein